MLTGFRAGPDSGIGVATDDFAGTRRAWSLPVGTAPIGRVFPNGASITTTHTLAQVVTKAQTACAPVLSAGMWPYLSFKPDVAATLAGQLDPHLAALGKWAAGLGVPVYLSMWHEPENDTMGAASTDYKWMPGSPETTDGPVADAWNVPAAARDFIAGDSYTANWSWASSGATLREKKDFQRWRRLLVGPDTAQLMLAERGISRNHTGATPEQSQADILRDDYTYLSQLGAYGLLYWNGDGGTDDSLYLLGPPAQAAFTEIAIGAATKPAPVVVIDRYQDGYKAGIATGRAEGVAAGRTEGRSDVLHNLGEWVATQAG